MVTFATRGKVFAQHSSLVVKWSHMQDCMQVPFSATTKPQFTMNPLRISHCTLNQCPLSLFEHKYSVTTPSMAHGKKHRLVLFTSDRIHVRERESLRHFSTQTKKNHSSADDQPHWVIVGLGAMFEQIVLSPRKNLVPHQIIKEVYCSG